jgi:hypothetical protein
MFDQTGNTMPYVRKARKDFQRGAFKGITALAGRY